MPCGGCKKSTCRLIKGCYIYVSWFCGSCRFHKLLSLQSSSPIAARQHERCRLESPLSLEVYKSSLRFPLLFIFQNIVSQSYLPLMRRMITPITHRDYLRWVHPAEEISCVFDDN